MTAPNTVFETVARELEARLRGQFESEIRARVDEVIEEGRQRLAAEAEGYKGRVEEAVTRVVLDAPTAPAPSVKADAKTRSWRTLVQGLIATVIVGGAGTLGTAVVDPDFQIDDWSDWRFAAVSAGTAAVAAVIAYAQRFVQPPKS